MDEVSDISVTGCAFDGNADNQRVWDEYEHSLIVLDSSNVRITGNRFLDSNGDRVYVGGYSADDGTPMCSSGVAVSSDTFKGTNRGRQAVSVTCGSQVNIQGNIVDNYTRTGMPDGIDLEPNRVAGPLEDITVSNNRVRNLNTGVRQFGGIMLANGRGTWCATCPSRATPYAGS